MLTKKQCIKYQPKTYGNDELLAKAYEHLITEKKSVWTLAHPTKQAYDKRAKSDAVFAEQFESILMLSYQNLETVLWDNMDNKNFNDKLFNLATKNKKPFASFEHLEMLERIEALEEQFSEK
jgi:hypothetical protein